MKARYFLNNCLLLACLAACSKHNTAPVQKEDSISIQAGSADTLMRMVSLAKDTVLTVALKAASGQPAASAHHVVFAVDTPAMAGYRAKYGDALLLPTYAYFFYRPDCYIPASTTLSDAAQINLVQQTSLEGYVTYVLPLRIQSVDNQPQDTRTGLLLYLVVQTGKASFFSKAGWKIVSASSSADAGDMATNLLDNDDQNTYWITEYSASLPQNVVIDFGKALTFSGVTYRLPSSYVGLGAPTRVKIELSDNGTEWVDKGTFDEPINYDAPLVINTGLSTARYLRFVILAGTSFFGSAIVIGGIGLNP